MHILSWIVLGLIAGFISSKIVNHHGSGVIVDTIIGMVGALIGGEIFTLVGMRGMTGFNLWSLFVATAGAVLVLVVYHWVRGFAHRHATPHAP
jgi:uncharacterized membrane protein YeaQ/YmgE (transglycosylase-associated protein family)